MTQKECREGEGKGWKERERDVCSRSAVEVNAVNVSEGVSVSDAESLFVLLFVAMLTQSTSVQESRRRGKEKKTGTKERKEKEEKEKEKRREEGREEKGRLLMVFWATNERTIEEWSFTKARIEQRDTKRPSISL